jgi:hypothetical protein
MTSTGSSWDLPCDQAWLREVTRSSVVGESLWTIRQVDPRRAGTARWVGTTVILLGPEGWFSTTRTVGWPFREIRQKVTARRAFATMEGVMPGASLAVAGPVSISWKATTLTIRWTTHWVVKRRSHREVTVPITHAPVASTVDLRAIESYVFGSAMAGTRVEVWVPVPSVIHQVGARGQSIIRRSMPWKTSLLPRINCGRTLDVWSLRDIRSPRAKS